MYAYFLIFQSNEVKNSYAMELEGLQRSLELLTVDNNLTVSDLVTDRHSAIKKYMREQQPEINHWFDVWHVAKGMQISLVLYYLNLPGVSTHQGLLLTMELVIREHILKNTIQSRKKNLFTQKKR